jgi:hypothetical protein
MLRHLVLIRWLEGCPDEAVRTVEEALSALPSQIPAIRGYLLGRDLNLNPANSDFAIVADFEDADAYRAYASDARHLQVIRELIEPWSAERRAVQFQLPD